MTRLGLWWEATRDSLWFVPALITLLAGALALGTLLLDARVFGMGRAEVDWAFQGGADGARGVLGAIASTMITVAGLVFSITMVVLQLTSSQYSPRVLQTFMRDRGNQVVLGVFIGTFAYTLLVLRSVRGENDAVGIFIPSLSVAVAIALALVSMGFLIYYIHHTARSIQVSTIIEHITRDTIGLVHALFPEPVGEPREERALPAIPVGEPASIPADQAGYLQAIDGDALFALAEQHQLVLRMEPRVGQFIVPSMVLASVWPAAAADAAVVDAVRQGFVLGAQRTLQHDVELGIQQLVDIALRALSPGINDPTTAINCIDRLAELLVALGQRERPEAARLDESGRVCLIARGSTFAEAARLSFEQIEHYGVSDPVVARHLVRTLGHIAAGVPPWRRAVLVESIHSVLDAARRATDEPNRRTRLEEAATRALEQAGGRGIVSPPSATRPDDHQHVEARRPA